MKHYVDGYIIPIKKKNVKAYKKMAQLGCKIWMEHGALSYYETVADAMENKWGWTFPKMCKLKADETVVFAFIVYKSKADRKKVNTRVHSDPRMQMEGTKMPFDMKKFSVAGFRSLVNSEE